MDISWNNIDNLDDYFITYLLYTESKTVSQISKIRNISVTEVNDHLIRAKLDIKSVNKAKVESSKTYWINFWNWEKMHDLNL